MKSNGAQTIKAARDAQVRRVEREKRLARAKTDGRSDAELIAEAVAAGRVKVFARGVSGLPEDGALAGVFNTDIRKR